MKDDLYQAIFQVSEALEVPVVVLALASLAWVLVELGAFLIEISRRLRRRLPALVRAADNARQQIDAGERHLATRTLQGVAWSWPWLTS